MVTQDRLKELFHYDPNVGDFIRLIGRRGPNARAGDIAGCDNGKGYIRIYVDGAAYKAHRLAWLYIYGDWPADVDHIDGDRANNRIANLRSVTKAENAINQGVYKNNTSGLKGVSYYKRGKKWKAQIQVSGKKKGLGYFETKEAAYRAYQEASKNMHGEFARSL